MKNNTNDKKQNAEEEKNMEAKLRNEYTMLLDCLFQFWRYGGNGGIHLDKMDFYVSYN